MPRPEVAHPNATAFSWAATPIRFGLGALGDLGTEISELDARRCLVLTDPGVAETGLGDQAVDLLSAEGIAAVLFSDVAIEPTDESIAKAVSFAKDVEFDALVAIGGGSVIDTAKAVNLLTGEEGELLDYVAPPLGGGRAPGRALRPLVAVPTTAGTGSESTPICVVDLLGRRLKAGISHHRLRPVLAIIDPLTSVSMPPEVTAASGMDVLCHAIESYTARRFDARPASVGRRPAFSGANPISDVLSERAIELVGRHLRRAVANGHDLVAREMMMLAATFAGIGFGNAGTHLPHANAYPIAGMAKGYHAAGYPEMPMVPHGQAVASTAGPSFRYTYAGSPERHRGAASLLAGRELPLDGGAELLPDALRALMVDTDMPLGIGAFGFTAADVVGLAEGTMEQQRQLSVSPRPVTATVAEAIFRQSL